ncbi:MAG TPA: hypothetical protein VM122_13980 [Usitatibacter sp.]|nr:hypothetical protein [Usitatibacter sp.]
MKKSTGYFLAVALCAAAVGARASCGAAFCLVNTDWTSQGSFLDPGMRFDLRYEYIDLDQPRAGRSRVGVGQVPRHHDEVETRNNNYVASVDWNLAPQWGLTLAVPYVDRDHLHVHNHHGETIPESWSFRGLGDLRLQSRYVLTSVAADGASLSTAGLTFGVKVPTGKHDVTNSEGELAERTLQPGTGTTDLLLGAYWHGAALDGWSWFTRAQAVIPTTTRDGFQPGRQLQVDGGARYALGVAAGLMLQVNAHVRGRDSGANAEPEDSGQRAVFVSPGISWTLGRDAQLYAFVQVPVYQAVNGVQLTADWSALAGVSFRF